MIVRVVLQPFMLRAEWTRNSIGHFHLDDSLLIVWLRSYHWGQYSTAKEGVMCDHYPNDLEQSGSLYDSSSIPYTYSAV